MVIFWILGGVAAACAITALFRQATVSAIGAPIVSGALWIVVSGLIAPVSSSPFRPATTVIIALSSLVVAALASSAGARPLPSVAIAAMWAALVSIPVAVVFLYPVEWGRDPLLWPIDLGGALVLFVAPGATAIVLGRSSAPPPAPGIPRAFGAAIALWIAWAALLVGLELAVDELTPVILSSVLIAPSASLVSFLLVRALRTRQVRPMDVATGVIAGLAAATPASALIEAPWSAVVGALAGVLAAAVAGRSTAPTTARLMVAALLVPAGVGLVAVGLFETGYGFIFAGQPDSAVRQLVAVVTVVGFSLFIGLMLRLAVRAIMRRMEGAD